MCTADGSMMLYPVRKGDTLTKIANEQFNAFGPALQPAIDRIMELNPQIRSPDMIYAGHMLLLEYSNGGEKRTTFGLEEMQQAQQSWNTKPKIRQEELAIMSRTVTAIGAASVVTGIGGTALGGVSSVLRTNKQHYYNAALEYARYKRGTISKHRYDELRRLHLSRLQANLGPLEKPVFSNKTVFETFRMSPGRSANPTAPYLKQIDKLENLTGKIKAGGAVLDFISLSLGIYDIATTRDSLEQDKKLVRLAAGAAASKVAQIGITRLIVGVALATTPIGWGAALVIGVGSIVAGELLSNLAETAYEKHFGHVRIVDLIEEIEIPGLD